MDNIIPFPSLSHIAPPADPHSHLAAIDRAKTEYPPFKGRILGCRVLLVRIEENWTHSGRFLLPDTYQHGSVMFRVLAVGREQWVHKRTGQFISNFTVATGGIDASKVRLVEIDVVPGDCVISRHWVQAQDPRHATWHQPQFLDNVDGSGRVIVDARFCELLWKQ